MTFHFDLFYKSLKIGLPTSIQQCAIAVGLIALLRIVNDFGTDTLTAYGAAGKVDTIFTQAILTLSGALAAFTGQNIGAGRMDRVKNGVRCSMAVNIIVGICIFISIYYWGDKMIAIFTTDPNVIRLGYDYLFVLGIFFVVHGALNIFNGVLRGAGDTFIPMLVSLLSLWLIRIPLASWLSHYYGTDGIWWSIGISIGIGCLIIFIYYKTGYWKKQIILITKKRINKRLFII